MAALVLTLANSAMCNVLVQRAIEQVSSALVNLGLAADARDVEVSAKAGEIFPFRMIQLCRRGKQHCLN